MQEFLQFALMHKRMLPNEAHFCTNSSNPNSNHDIENGAIAAKELPPSIREYYSKASVNNFPDRIDKEKILIFDSNFESGNLDRVSIVSLSEYNLFLNADTNAKGNSLWFYFSVSNSQAQRTVAFNILNCTKHVLALKTELKPVAFSVAEYRESGVGWSFDTAEAYYSRNEKENGCYVLRFEYTFKRRGDKVYFACFRPYTVSMHRQILAEIKDKLLGEATSVETLKELELQKEIKQFVQNSSHKGSRKSSLDEDQAKAKSPKKKPAALPEQTLAPSEILARHSETHPKLPWLKPQDIRIRTQSFIYQHETLCYSFGGLPVDLVTVTALQ